MSTECPGPVRGDSVRVVIELIATAGGHVAGSVQVDRDDATSFDGWLELLRSIEDVVADRC